MVDLVKHASHAAPGGSARSRAVDTGMALTLVCLIVGLLRNAPGWFALATALLVVNMTAPKVFGPAAKVWFGLSALLGAVMSKVILSVIYFVVLTPVGLLRRALGKDTLRLRDFKKGAGSVFVTRSGPFTPADLKTPF
jgi:hypothetical protein